MSFFKMCTWREFIARFAMVCGLTTSLIAAAQQIPAEAPSNPANRAPLVISKQGSFFYGGQTITGPGAFDPSNLVKNAGDIFSVDSSYAFFQIPVDTRRLPIVMWHGGGQTGKTYEDFEGRDNYQSILLRRGWNVYTIDASRRGKAGVNSFTGPLGTLLGKQVGPPITIRYGIRAGFLAFRLGNWPDSGPSYFADVQFPRTEYALEQLAAQTIAFYPEDGDIPGNGAAQVPLFNKIGPSVLVTHSSSGGPGWYSAMGSANIRAIVCYEPGPNPKLFVFPEGEPGPPGTAIVPLSDFLKLTKIPIQIVYGDNMPKVGGNQFQQLWRKTVDTARSFAAAINRHGGDAQVLELPEAGLRGNTHFPFADLNNEAVADILSKYLHSKGLDTRGGT